MARRRIRRALQSHWAALFLAAVLLGPVLTPGPETRKPIKDAAKPGRIRLVPVASDQRIEDIQESADGSRLLTHDRGYSPRLWDAKRLRLLKVLGGHRDQVFAAFFSNDGSRIATISGAEVHLWDAKKAIDLSSTAAPLKDNFTVGRFSPDGKSFAAGTGLGKIMMLGESAPQRYWPAHDGAVLDLQFSSDGTYLVSSGRDKLVRSWEPDSMKLRQTYSGHVRPARWVQISRDGKQILTTELPEPTGFGQEGPSVARLFDAESGRQVYEKPHFVAAKGILASTLMSALFVGSKDDGVLVARATGKMPVYNRTDGAQIREFVGHTAGLREIRQTTDRSKIATYGDDELLGLWDADTGQRLPFKRETNRLPTAGEFSPDGAYWWLGMSDGSITKYDLKTGDGVNTAIGTVLPARRFHLSQDLRSLSFEMKEGGGLQPTFGTLVFDTLAPGAGTSLVIGSGSVISEDGKSAVVYSTDDEPLPFYDLKKRRASFSLKTNIKRVQFSEDGSTFVAATDSGKYFLLDAHTGEPKHAWEVPGAEINNLELSPDGKILLLGPTKEGNIQLINSETGKGVAAFKYADFNSSRFAFSHRGDRVAVFDRNSLVVYDLTGKGTKVTLPLGPPKDVNLTLWHVGCLPRWSANDAKVILASGDRLAVWDIASGKAMLDLDQSVTHGNSNLVTQISPDGNFALQGSITEVNLWDVATGNKVGGLRLNDNLGVVGFSPDGGKILTLDNTDGLGIWSTKPDAEGKLPKLGAFTLLQDGSWLTLDSEGRYDASDPSAVDGASFVLEWDGGLEPLDVPRFKQQFYEPGLLGKLLGVSKDSLRSVPKLDGLRLFPEVSITRNAANKDLIDIRLKERDRGGVGKIQVLVNGKLLAEKEDTSYFQFDSQTALAYMLPQTQLPAGQGNVLTILAANEKGDLTGPPAVFDLGIPSGLKTPEVRLHALFVGVGKYRGDANDLQSPPSDATSLAQTVKDVANRLLPARISITTMVTGEGDASRAPSKENIRKWFETTAKAASSGDIVMVFFAGHGCDHIGDQSDYFFLTSDCDPSDLTATVATTSAISGKEIQRYLAAIPANKQIVILDTCHSGAASKNLLSVSRSVSGDYQRAYEAIRDTTGTWMLAGSAADQLSYESSNVEHGMLTYALLEAIDKASGDGLRKGSGEDLFVDVESWLGYAASRVESLKNEVGIGGIQRPQFRRALSASSFDIGVTNKEQRGKLGLKPPRPIVILGTFEQDQEDPLGLEKWVEKNLKSSNDLKVWTDIAKHPNVFRVAGTYVVTGTKIAVKVVFQKFDNDSNRQTVSTFTVTGDKQDLAGLGASIRAGVEKALDALEKKG